MSALVAGLVVETVPGAEPRVAARLARVPGLELAGGDGVARLAIVLEAADAEALEAEARRLVDSDGEIVAMWPTFVGDDEAG